MKNVEKQMSERILMVANSVNKCGSVWDTGSDHAFAVIYLIQKNVCEYAMASDIKPGPAGISRKNIKGYGLTEKISVSISDGIEKAAGFDCIVIAGMGGELIKNILERSAGIAQSAKQLVLQPMNAPEKLRRYLWDNGYSIYYESLCREKHKVYNVICAKYTGKRTEYKELELHASSFLVENKHTLLKEYLKPKLKRLSDMANGGNEAALEIKKRLEEL